MTTSRRFFVDLFLTVAILGFSFVALVLVNKYRDTQSLAPMLFVLAVLVISLITNGYAWGIVASLVSVLAVNYAFTFPFFEVNFSIPENLFSASVMLIVAIITGTLTTKIKRQEAIKAEIEKETVRANLLRAVSHDLRTPLTSIYGSSSVVLENYDRLSKEQKLKLLGEICEDSEWLIRIVENLLSITRVNGGSVSVIKTPTSLEELIDSVLVKFKKRYPEQIIKLNIPDGFISIPMDPLLIEQVIINILENAVYHARGMTEISLSVSLADGCAVFEVADNGCGISADRLATLFTGCPEKSTEKADGGRKGMGIGLAVCATIIKAHGGEISARSKVGEYTVISFSLETEEAEETEGA